MSVLVTGGTGFLGSHLLALLGGSVRALVRRESGRIGCQGHMINSPPTPATAEGGPPIAMQQIVGDVEDPASLARALDGVTQVYHLAGLVSRDRRDATAMMRLHVDGTRNLLSAAVAAGVKRVVLASSSGTIAVSRTDSVATEASPFALDVVKGWPYYLSKIYQEQVAAAFSDRLELVTVNPSLLLGPGDTRGSSTDDVRKLLDGKIYLVPDGGVNFVDVRDAAAAFVAAMERGRPGERYLVGGPNWTFANFFDRIGRVAKLQGPRFKLPERLSGLARAGASALSWLAEKRGETPTIDRISVEMGEHYWYLDAGKAKRELGFAARDPQETLLDTVRWLRKHRLA